LTTGSRADAATLEPEAPELSLRLAGKQRVMRHDRMIEVQVSRVVHDWDSGFGAPLPDLVDLEESRESDAV
jgi:hypothetical protein